MHCPDMSQSPHLDPGPQSWSVGTLWVSTLNRVSFTLCLTLLKDEKNRLNVRDIISGV